MFDILCIVLIIVVPFITIFLLLPRAGHGNRPCVCNKFVPNHLDGSCGVCRGYEP